tara:strand:- start:387 stop:662 length:276 start_codon:yes stop_codon:yes gene_type:complete
MKITKAQLKRLIKEELSELGASAASPAYIILKRGAYRTGPEIMFATGDEAAAREFYESLTSRLTGYEARKAEAGEGAYELQVWSGEQQNTV